jgi:hypothetical protein
VEEAVKSAITVSAELTCRNPQKQNRRKANNFMDDMLEIFWKPLWHIYRCDEAAK